VIGSGPSAFYAAEALLKAPDLAVRIDVFERLPTPFGLVRGGVAPDHQKIKSVTKQYEKTAADPRLRFFGNVMLGRDLRVEDLVACYDQIVYAVGNESDRRLAIPGEDLAGVHSATAFVGWYNGHPDYRDQVFDLGGAERVAVVGNGNVAIDVTRILIGGAERLADTDIADYALEALRRSRVREVLLLGRRGPAQAAFSPKEIAELGMLPGVDVVVPPVALDLDEHTVRWLETSAPRSARRNLEYLAGRSALGEGSHARKVRCQFLVSPVELVGHEGRVSAIRLQHNELYADRDGTPRPRPTERYTTEPVQLVFAAIGYRGVPIPGVPFDEREGIIPNAGGRVLAAPGGQPVPGQYVVGWAKRGPTGLIGTNSPDSKLTVQAMLADLEGADAAPLPADDLERVPRLLAERGVDAVTYDDWCRLDGFEVEAGRARGCVRAKLTSVAEMMDVIRRLRAQRG
jgi:ferredoxin--NADP+ reductase